MEVFKDYLEAIKKYYPNNYRTAMCSLQIAIENWENFYIPDHMYKDYDIDDNFFNIKNIDSIYKKFHELLWAKGKSLMNNWTTSGLIRKFLEFIDISYYEQFYDDNLLVEPISTDNPFIFYKFLEMGANPSGDYGLTPLSCSIDDVSIFYIKNLLENKRFDFKFLYKEGVNLLEEAKRNSSKEVYTYLKNVLKEHRIIKDTKQD